jgi:uncharacterized membrane protein
MRIPPLVARVRIGTPVHSVPLWVPIVLVWAPLLVLAAPLLLLALLAALVVAPRWSFLALARGIWDALCEARGTRIDFQGDHRRVSIALD